MEPSIENSYSCRTCPNFMANIGCTTKWRRSLSRNDVGVPCITEQSFLFGNDICGLNNPSLGTILSPFELYPRT
jgi:hypothetical protein